MTHNSTRFTTRKMPHAMGGIFRGRFVLTALAIVIAVLQGCAHTDVSSTDAVALYDAIERDDVGYVRAAVQSGALGVNQSIPVPGYAEGAPVITIAARSAALGILRYLIAAGADVNARTSIGETALMLAAFFSSEEGGRGRSPRERHDDAVRMLIAAGADLDNHAHHYTPLCYAAYHGHDTAVSLLLARGARVNGPAEDGGTYVNTPLMMAAIQGHMSTALQLLRAGADPTIRVHGGHTAAELAAKYRHVELAHLLRCAERHGRHGFEQHHCRGGMSEQPTSRMSAENQPSPRHR
jgi:serine/threonine-protein phosphatase 6 regulatory ankyrin repeat subunit B